MKTGQRLLIEEHSAPRTQNWTTWPRARSRLARSPSDGWGSVAGPPASGELPSAGDYLRRGVKEGVTEHGLGDPHFLAVTYHSAPLVLRYLARALTDDSPAAAALFDEMVGLTEDYLSGHDSGTADTRAQAAVLTAMKLGTVVLHAHLSRALSADTLTPAGLPRVRAAMVDIVAEEFSGPELTGLLRAGVEQHQHLGTAATLAAERHDHD